MVLVTTKSFEFWKPIRGYEGLYEISIIGVRSVERVVQRMGSDLKVKEKFLKPVIAKTGYYVISLNKNNKSKKFTSHRLLSTHFIFNKHSEKKFVNHKNGVKLDIRLSNFEWTTQAENNLHAYSTGLRNGNHKRLERRGAHSCAKKVGMFLQGSLIKIFNCKIDAEEFSRRTVGYFITKGHADPDGFNWKYIYA